MTFLKMIVFYCEIVLLIVKTMKSGKYNKPLMVKLKDDNMLAMVALIMGASFEIVETMISIAVEVILMTTHNANQENETRGVDMLPVIDSWNRPDDRETTYSRMVELITNNQHLGVLCLPLVLVDSIMQKANVKHYQRCGDSIWDTNAIKVVFFKI